MIHAFGPFELDGVRSAAELGRWARHAASHTGMSEYFRELLLAGELARVTESVARDPSRLDAQVRLGEMYEQLQLISDAMSVFEDVSTGYMRAGDTDGALRMLGKMVDLDPEHIPVRIKYAEALSRAGRTQDAAVEFEQGAQLLKDQGRLDDYIKVAERLLYHRSNDVRIAKELAETYIARRDPKRALGKLQFCFKADPRDVSTLSLLAEAFLMLQQTDKAISVYREIARIHREALRPRERMSALHRILELNPHDKEARAALDRTAAASA